jgi:NAD(P)H dehydrogenase (quinone)
MITIIYTHPYTGSFNHAILEQMQSYFTTLQRPYQIIDLYQDEFEPRYSGEELRNFSQGQTPYQLVRHYQQLIKASSELLFITPIWWFNLPAELKGFFDKVMLKDFAYTEVPEWRGLLTYIKRATIITTATVTKSYLQTEAGDLIQRNLIDRVFADIGIDPNQSNWIHFGEVNLTTDAVRQRFLEELPNLYTHGQA